MFRLLYLPFAVAVATLVLLLAPTAVHAQSFDQTLPPGYMNTDGLWPTGSFNGTDDITEVWYYDASLFSASGPILINEIYVRAAASTDVVDSFDYTDFEVTLFESSNPYNALDNVFANNIQRGLVVRSGPFTKGNLDTTTANGVTGGWIPFRLERSFLYDPTSGNPLGIRVRPCGVNTSMNVNIDVPLSPFPLTSLQAASSVLGVACSSPTQTYDRDYAPIVKIDYTPVMEQTLPAGFLATEGNGSTNLPFNTPPDSTWHWHYDSSEFAATGPITISEISVRANSGSSSVSAFDFNKLEVTLIEASTDYQFGSHDSTFANNILRSETVRIGSFSGPGTQAGGSTGSWISLQLTSTFDYDPTSGNDFIIELRVCGPNALFGTTIDGVSGAAGSVGGNRYGNTTSCTAVTSDFQNNEFVPVVKVSYTERIISAFPHRENFDHFGGAHPYTLAPGGVVRNVNLPPGWINDSSNSPRNWRPDNEEFYSGSASSDHTTGKTGLGFFVAAADDPFSNQNERLESPIFDLTSLSSPLLTFWLFSNSLVPPTALDENSFTIDVKRIDGFTFPNVLIPVTLHQSGSWTKYGVDLSPFANDQVALVFRANTDNVSSGQHDFAVDDVFVGEAAPSEGGQAATVNGRLDVNNSWNNNGFHTNTGADGPFYTRARPGENLYINVDTPYPYQPTALWLGPLNIGVATFGVLGQMDTGTPDTTGDGIPESIFLIGSGLNPNPSFFDLFFFTNGAGDLELVLPTNPSFPPGLFGTFQSATADGSGNIFLSNAVRLTFGS